jgi:undecaprenyl-diphosphatase
MIENLMQLDRELLLFLNGINSPFWDNFFLIYTSAAVWIPFYVLIVAAILFRQHTKGLLTVLFLILVVVLTDQISSTIIKGSIERLRPSHEPALEGIVKLINNIRYGKYGFTSSHAANTFGLAMFSSLLFKNLFGSTLPRRYFGGNGSRINYRLPDVFVI